MVGPVPARQGVLECYLFILFLHPLFLAVLEVSRVVVVYRSPGHVECYFIYLFLHPSFLAVLRSRGRWALCHSPRHVGMLFLFLHPSFLAILKVSRRWVMYPLPRCVGMFIIYVISSSFVPSHPQGLKGGGSCTHSPRHVEMFYLFLHPSFLAVLEVSGQWVVHHSQRCVGILCFALFHLCGSGIRWKVMLWVCCMLKSQES